MVSDKLTLKLAILTTEEIEEIVRKVVRELKKDSPDATQRRRSIFRTTLRKSR